MSVSYNDEVGIICCISNHCVFTYKRTDSARTNTFTLQFRYL